MLTRYFSPQRNTWLISLCVGIIVALLAGSIQFMVIYHNRAERFDVIINNVNSYLKSYFHNLRQTIDGLQPLVDQPERGDHRRAVGREHSVYGDLP